MELQHGDLRLRLKEAFDAVGSPWGVDALRFDILLGEVPVGTISLRLGDDYRITHIAGQIGYGIDEAHRGRGYAGRAVTALLPLARSRGLNPVWLTTTPENAASRRTLEKLGARLVETVDIPEAYDSYARGERVKLRYAL